MSAPGNLLLSAPADDPGCTCRFATVHTRSGHQWVFRRDPACPEHRRIAISR